MCTMAKNDGLDKWIDKPKLKSPNQSKNNIVLDSLRERILELEETREQILQEITRLKSLEISGRTSDV